MTLPALAQARPDDFFIPGLDPGLSLVQLENLKIGVVPPVRIEALALASNFEHRVQITDIMERHARSRWKKGVVFPTVLAVAEDLALRHRLLTIGDKYFMNSEGGWRMRNSYAGQKNGKASDAALVAHLAEKSFENRRPLPLFNEDYRQLDFVIETRNFYNFYHFTKETLPHLTLVERYGLTGRVLIAGPNRKVSDFVMDAVKAWFPELVDRVEITGDTVDFGRALIGLDTRIMYYQCRDALIPSIQDVSDVPVKRRFTTGNLRLASINSYEQPLGDLRQRALAVLQPAPPSRRLFVVRRSGRQRNMVGGDLLEARLKDMGFEVVAFEDHTVAEQARMVAEAEAVVLLHGAGTTNMLYVPEGCLVVELSNLQTLRKRFGDFNPIAIAAGARYLHVFADHDFPNPDVVPVISEDGHRGVVLSSFEADVIASHIASVLDPAPAQQALEACRVLNDARETAALSAALDVHAAVISHEADFHVWRANVASDSGDKIGALEHLRRALVLAPGRVPLLTRTLNAAHAQDDRRLMIEAAALFLLRAPRKAEKLFNEKGWSFEIPLPEAEEAPDWDEGRDDT
ncbi:DUF563 domain-containing protein [Falsirhodobacter sp. alg1]|uniref:glycosyltransferase family 61 protein n=1 Tax=Falsirhodobacter sp. alg1 TaxID=1472418 RepID=UPI0007870A97|nr:glycosyltransferase family 61 protein [Falsirhodobacter sp. alg1]